MLGHFDRRFDPMAGGGELYRFRPEAGGVFRVLADASHDHAHGAALHASIARLEAAIAVLEALQEAAKRNGERVYKDQPEQAVMLLWDALRAEQERDEKGRFKATGRSKAAHQARKKTKEALASSKAAKTADEHKAVAEQHRAAAEQHRAAAKASRKKEYREAHEKVAAEHEKVAAEHEAHASKTAQKPAGKPKADRKSEETRRADKVSTQAEEKSAAAAKKNTEDAHATAAVWHGSAASAHEWAASKAKTPERKQEHLDKAAEHRRKANQHRDEMRAVREAPPKELPDKPPAPGSGMRVGEHVKGFSVEKGLDQKEEAKVLDAVNNPRVMAILKQHPINDLRIAKAEEGQTAFGTQYYNGITMRTDPIEKSWSEKRVKPIGLKNFDPSVHKDMWNVAMIAGGPAEMRRNTLIHEVGHHLHDVDIMRAGSIMTDAFARAEQTKSFLTEYSKTNRHEYFAESFALWHERGPEFLAKHDPNGGRMVEDVLRVAEQRRRGWD